VTDRIRVAFVGFNEACARLVEALAGDPRVEVVGIVGTEGPRGWPEAVPVPPLLSDPADLEKRARPDVVFLAKEADEGVFSGEVVPVWEGASMEYLTSFLSGRAVLERKMREEIEQVTSLCADTRLAEAYGDPFPKLAQLMDRAMALFDMKFGMIAVPGEVGQEMSVLMARGSRAEGLAGRSLGMNSSLCGEAFNQGKPLQRRVTEECEEFEFLSREGVAKAILVPMRAEGRVVGVFLLADEGEDELDSLKLSLFSLVADQAGLVLQIARLYSELEANLNLDSLTGLYNQHFFLRRLSEEISRARRYSLNVSLVLLELDDLSGYRERNGRTMAELVLSDLGSLIKRSTREVDLAARYGEERFALLLPETRRIGALRLAERLLGIIADYPFPSARKGETERLTACAGVASYPANAENDRELLFKAMDALERAKRSGPGSFHLYGT
jgi:diguanylate cyclase (GGDEF)-like protein